MTGGVAAGLVASACAGAATGLGALPILFSPGFRRRTQDRLLGGLFLRRWHDAIPHEHELKGREGRGGLRLGHVPLIVLAIMLHNLPEGLAVGVRVAGPDARLGLPVALAIAVQNLPEGLVVAVALRTAGVTAGLAFAGGAMLSVVSNEIIPESHQGGFEREATAG